jgi:hypothetical protein
LDGEPAKCAGHKILWGQTATGPVIIGDAVSFCRGANKGSRECRRYYLKKIITEIEVRDRRGLPA